jgi:hypothetical protein
MTRPRKVLLVEGSADTVFYEAFLRKVGVRGVAVEPPRNLGAGGDGKANAIHLLPALIEQLKDARLLKLAVVIDADYTARQLGFADAYNKVTTILGQYGYAIPYPYPGGKMKYLFEHPDGLPTFGCWIMPDNANDGMVENLVLSEISAAQKPLMAKAIATVQSIAVPLFDIATHRVKANVYTWLAWQRIPGKPLASAVGDDLIDLNSPLARQFSDWLRKAFE